MTAYLISTFLFFAGAAIVYSWYGETNKSLSKEDKIALNLIVYCVAFFAVWACILIVRRVIG